MFISNTILIFLSKIKCSIDGKPRNFYIFEYEEIQKKEFLGFLFIIIVIVLLHLKKLYIHTYKLMEEKLCFKFKCEVSWI